jgi:hypothetical protein
MRSLQGSDMTGAMPIDASQEGIVADDKTLSAAIAGTSLTLTLLALLITLASTTNYINVSTVAPLLITVTGAAFTAGSLIYYFIAPTTAEEIEEQIPEMLQR